MNTLAKEECADCKNAKGKLDAASVKELSNQLDTEWEIKHGHHLERGFSFKDFKGALAFTNRVGELAEQQGHHPDIRLGWGEVVIELWTHSVDGLTRADFVLAAKIDDLADQEHVLAKAA